MLKNGTTGSADNTTWTTCTSPLNYTNMPEGRYGFQLQVTDRANVSTTPVPCAIAVDTTAPNTTIASGPDKNDLQPPQVTFTLVADDGAYGSNVSLYQCQLNKISDADYQQLRGGSVTVDIQLASTTWFNCSSTTVVDQTQLSTGNWAFRARVVDNAGNVGVPTAVYVFRVDSSIPIPSSVQASSSSMCVYLLFICTCTYVDTSMWCNTRAAPSILNLLTQAHRCRFPSLLALQWVLLHWDSSLSYSSTHAVPAAAVQPCHLAP